MSKGSGGRGGGGGGVAKRAAPGGAARTPAGKAASFFGVENTPEFQRLHSDDAFQLELENMKFQQGEVNRGRKNESDTPWGRQGLTPTEYAAMQVYSSGSYKRINNTLRDVTDATPKQKQVAKAYETAVSRALDKLPNQPGTAYRGIGANRLGALGDVKPGDTISDKGFASSSTSREIAKGFGRHTLVIRHKSGKDFSKVVGGFENEVLFKPGTKFKVRKVETDQAGNTTITVEET
jgi:hypothetical protein